MNNQDHAVKHHDIAMEHGDRANLLLKQGHTDRAVAEMLNAARNEHLAAVYVAHDESARTTYYQSAATLTRIASIHMAKRGLQGSPDAKLKADLEVLATSAWEAVKP